MSIEAWEDFQREVELKNFNKLVEKSKAIQINLARGVLDKSGLKNLCIFNFEFIGKINEGTFEEVSPDFPGLINYEENSESAFIEVSWNQHFTDTDYSADAFLIEALPSGNIIVRGNLIGTTILYPKDLEDKEIKKKAIEKARSNPLSIYKDDSEGYFEDLSA